MVKTEGNRSCKLSGRSREGGGPRPGAGTQRVLLRGERPRTAGWMMPGSALPLPPGHPRARPAPLPPRRSGPSAEPSMLPPRPEGRHFGGRRNAGSGGRGSAGCSQASAALASAVGPGQQDPPRALLRRPLRHEASALARDRHPRLRVSDSRRRPAPARPAVSYPARSRRSPRAPAAPRGAWRPAQTRWFVSAGASGEARAETMPGKLKVKIVAGRHLPVMDRASDLTDAFVEVGARSCCSKLRARPPRPRKDPTHLGPSPSAHSPSRQWRVPCASRPPGGLAAETAAQVEGVLLAGVRGSVRRAGRLLLLCMLG